MSSSPRLVAARPPLLKPGRAPLNAVFVRRAARRKDLSEFRRMRRWTEVPAGLPIADAGVAAACAWLVGCSSASTAGYGLAAAPLVSLVLGYHRIPVGGREGFKAVLRLVIAAVVAQWLVFQTTEPFWGEPVRGRGLLLVVTTVTGWSVVRLFVALLERRSPDRVIVLGSGLVADRLLRTVRRHQWRRMEIIGFLDDVHGAAPSPAALPCLGSVGDLPALAARGEVDRVMVAFSRAHPDEALLDVLRDCDAFGVHVDVIPRLFEYLGTETRRYSIGSLPLTTVRGRGRQPVSKVVKRAFDMVSAGIAALVTAPVMAVVALAVWLEDRGPILFRQERIGRGGRTFEILKFRSMGVQRDDSAEARQHALDAAGIARVVIDVKVEGERRVTKVGRFIRRTSLDELPQLWNVVRGDMSLVGPRPLRDFEVAALTGWEMTRTLERPGITGLWQVTGRSDVTWEERMLLDYTYVRHWSLARDVDILIRTVPVVLARSGAR